MDPKRLLIALLVINLALFILAWLILPTRVSAWYTPISDALAGPPPSVWWVPFVVLLATGLLSVGAWFILVKRSSPE
jgi:hypothetical protein